MAKGATSAICETCARAPAVYGRRFMTAVAILVLSLLGLWVYSDAPSKQMATIFAVIACLAGVRVAWLTARDNAARRRED